MATQTTDKLNVDKLMQVLSEILSKKYGCKITMTARLKPEYANQGTQNDNQFENTAPKAG